MGGGRMLTYKMVYSQMMSDSLRRTQRGHILDFMVNLASLSVRSLSCQLMTTSDPVPRPWERLESQL